MRNRLWRFFLNSKRVLLLSFLSISLGAQNTLDLDANIKGDTLLARSFLEKEKMLTDEGNFVAAVEVIEEAQELYARHGLWEAAIKCAVKKSKVADNLETIDFKTKYAQEAIQLSRQYLPENHPLLASAFRQKAEVMMMVENLDSANYFLNKAIPIFKKAEDWTELGWSEIILGVNFLNQSQLDSSNVHFLKVQKLLEQKVLSKEDDLNIRVTVLNLLGVQYQIQGDFDKAIINTQQALALDLDKAVLTREDSSYISEHYNNLGAFFYKKGDHQKAYDYFIQATSYLHVNSADPLILNNIGELLNRQRKFKKAIRYFQQSINLTSDKSELSKLQINALNGLGISYRELGLYDEAISNCQQAISLPSDYRQAISLSTIGVTYLKNKQAIKAIEYLNKALAAYKKDSINLVNASFFDSRIYYQLGEAHALKKQFNTALEFYQKALAANHSNFSENQNLIKNPSLSGVYEPIFFLETIHSKAKGQASWTDQAKQQKAALATYQLTIQWIDTLQESYVTETAQLDWSATFKPIYEGAIQVAFRLYQNTGDPEYLESAFAFSEKSKNAILLEALKSKEGQGLADVPDHLINKEKDLNLDIAFYEKSLQKAQQQKAADKVRLYQQYLSTTRLELATLKEQLEQDYPTFQNWKYGGGTISIGAVQSKLLDKETALLEYFIGDSSAYVFVISQHSAEMFALDSPSEIDPLVNDFRESLLDPSAFERNAKSAIKDYYQKAIKGYKTILQQSIEILPATVEQLIIIPDGVLNTIPFEALCKPAEIDHGFDFAKLPYVLYKYNLNYAYSTNLLLKNKNQLERLPANTNCLAFAPPYHGNQQIAQRGKLKQLRSVTGQLEGTSREIQQISHFIEGQFNFDKNATEELFKSQADQFGILHLAMHGVLDLDNAAFNHLIFSNSSLDNSEDNLLHQYEIANMDLNAQLVVLSACETGVGKYEKGEGVYSLARSFMYSGVPSVVMSLWKVSDASTSQLMPMFYGNLKMGKTKSVALQEAKIQFLQEANIEFKHPFYWSAFVLMGDAQKLKTGDSSIWWYGLGGILLLMLTGFFWRRNKIRNPNLSERP